MVTNISRNLFNGVYTWHLPQNQLIFERISFDTTALLNCLRPCFLSQLPLRPFSLLGMNMKVLSLISDIALCYRDYEVVELQTTIQAAM